VAENNARDRASTAAMGAGYAPAVAQTNPDGSPRMGVMRITTPDGEVHERQAQQYADSSQTKEARAVAAGYGIQAGEQARGQYFADLATQRRQDADLVDPAGAVARSKVDLNTAEGAEHRANAAAVPVRTAADAHAKEAQAGLYQQQGYRIEQTTPVEVSQGQAKVREADARTDLSKANTGYRIAMTPVDVARGQAQTDLAHSQGAAADASAGLTKERTTTEVATRQPTVAKLGAEAAHEQALAAQPHAPRPDHAYEHQRQNLADQIDRVRAQLSDPNLTNDAAVPLRKQLDGLWDQMGQLSLQRMNQGQPPAGYGVAPAAPQQPAAPGYGIVNPAAAPTPSPAPSPAAVAPPAAPGGLARVTTDAEFAALPPGTLFVGPDGRRRRKP
jgi:hypothetical protein